jgi:hypothetical protein
MNSSRRQAYGKPNYVFKQKDGRIVFDQLKRNDWGAAVTKLCTNWNNDALDKLAIGILKRRWYDEQECTRSGLSTGYGCQCETRCLSLDNLMAELRRLRDERDGAIGSRRDRTPEEATQHSLAWIAANPR